jgi:hypothetical protein
MTSPAAAIKTGIATFILRYPAVNKATVVKIYVQG